jgi:hypothetical protein
MSDMSDMSEQKNSSEDTQALRDRIERETPWLEIVDLAHGYVEVRDTQHQRIRVGFRNTGDWQDYLRVVGT